jgi:hypothetical protein
MATEGTLAQRYGRRFGSDHTAREPECPGLNHDNEDRDRGATSEMRATVGAEVPPSPASGAGDPLR